MKTATMLPLLVLAIMFSALSVREAKADRPTAKVITDFVTSPLHLEPSISAYPTFWKPVRPLSLGGYGLYSTFDTPKDMVAIGEKGEVTFRPWICREDYCVIFGNVGWHTFRRQFTQIIDLSQADGVEITIVVDKPMRGYRKADPEKGNFNTRLRFVLCDRNWNGQNTLRKKVEKRFQFHFEGQGVVRDEDKRWDFDNQWVYDLPDTILYKTQTVTVKVPFRKLHKPDTDEEGSRISANRRFRPAQTTAYEIAVIGSWTQEFKVVSIVLYQDEGK